MPDAPPPRKLPSIRGHLQIALCGIGFLWAVYLAENLTPLRLGHDHTRPPLTLAFPLIGTPIVAICTLWQFWRATVYARGSVEVLATVVKITHLYVTMDRVRIEYEYHGQNFSKRLALSDDIAAGLKVGSKLTIIILRGSPKRVRLPVDIPPA